jgi:hypothetical protein
VRAVNAREVLVIDRAGQIEADDFGAHRTAERADVERLWRDAWRW